MEANKALYIPLSSVDFEVYLEMKREAQQEFLKRKLVQLKLVRNAMEAQLVIDETKKADSQVTTVVYKK